MIKIILCDDDREAIDQYARLIEKISEKHSIEVAISSFYSGEELLFHLSDSPNQADIIYLDILMRQVNGMDTAKRLREIGCKSEIIFLTTSEDFVYEAFDIDAVQYLLKSATTAVKFEQVFLRAAKLAQEKAADMFIFESGGAQTVIPINEIAFFEISKRVIVVHCNSNETMKFYSSMKHLENRLLNKGFIRVHQSYLVNLHYISRFHQNSLFLKTGENIQIGITYLKHVKKTFTDYIGSAGIHGYDS